MFSAFTTAPHSTIALSIQAAKDAGEPERTSLPSSRILAATSACARTLLSSSLRRETTGAGVPFGA